MRAIYGTILSSVLATAVAGCNVLNLDYFREGIGSELSASETAAATEDAYLGQICRQAGLPRIITADGVVYCDQSADWTLVVQAGMNDIDRRCDGYLAWLDDKRRSSEPFLRQLAATGASTLGILDATGASQKAITLTGIAFGLAANTFTNINSRLLALNHSTVHSVVLDNQQKFRSNNKGVRIDSRPMAIYFLRNYLRICLPFSIETSVNNTVTVFHRAGSGALDDDNTLFTRTLITDSTRRFGRQQEGRFNPAPDVLDPHERNLTPDQIEGFQLALCQKDDGILGKSGSNTRKAIIAYMAEIGRPSANGAVTRNVAVFLGRAVKRVGDCLKSTALTDADRTPAGVGKLVKSKK